MRNQKEEVEIIGIHKLMKSKWNTAVTQCIFWCIILTVHNGCEGEDQWWIQEEGVWGLEALNLEEIVYFNFLCKIVQKMSKW